jgi:hypothetical protein
MSNYSVKIQDIVSPFNPVGLNGLKLVIDKKQGELFFRRKITGSLDFVAKDFKNILSLETECCKELSVIINQDCNPNTNFYLGSMKTQDIDWDFDLCSAKLSEIQQKDEYVGIFKYWERKVNMCSVQKSQAVRYINRIEISDTQSNYNEVTNNRGVYFVDWVYFCIQQTFEGTEYENIIPTDRNTMSSFLNQAINPCTGKRNSLGFSVVYQATDFMFSQSQSATGLLSNGLINDDLAVSFKDLFEELRVLFDLYFFIDNGKIRIEHLSYFENNSTYVPNNQAFSLDLSNQKFSKYLKDYKYSYKNVTEGYFGIEELKMTLNEAMFKSKNATIDPVSTNYGTEIYGTGYAFGRFTDFELGNIKFTASCVSNDEKGVVKKNIRNSSLFLTAIEPLRLADDSVDKNKWVLLDCKKIGESVELNEIIESNCERVVRRMANANFSATSIMRDFLRYNKPFSVGLMSYSDKPSGLIGKGYNREMYSLIKSKKLKKISIPFCCEDSFNPNLLVRLPNFTMAFCEKAEFQLSDSMLNLDLMQVSNCGNDVKFPIAQNEGDCPVRGLILNVEQVEIQVDFQNICDDNGCYPEPIYAQATRTTYADGECGSYIEDVIN